MTELHTVKLSLIPFSPVINSIQVGPHFLLILSPKCLLTPLPPFIFPIPYASFDLSISSLNNSNSLLTYYLFASSLYLFLICFPHCLQIFLFLMPIWTHNPPDNGTLNGFPFPMIGKALSLITSLTLLLLSLAVLHFRTMCHL